MRKILAIVLIGVCVYCAGCGSKTETGSPKQSVKKQTIHISYQPALDHAPFYIMKELGLLEKALPDCNIEWSLLGNAVVTAEAAAGGRLDIAAVGYPQLFILWDKSIEVKALCSIGETPYELLVNKESYNSIRDFIPSDRIALPSLGGVFSILFGMACNSQLGNAHALDTSLVAMQREESAISLINGNVTANFASMPHLAQLKEKGYKTILTGTEAFGGNLSGAVVFATKKIHDENPAALAVVYAALCDTISMINNRDPVVIKIIAATNNISEEKALEYLNWDGTNFSTTLYGVDGFADVMYREGYISKKPAMEDILWEPALAAIGKRQGEPGILEKAQGRGE
jgi:NitT/TauT family transport system substrate-binding protein